MRATALPSVALTFVLASGLVMLAAGHVLPVSDLPLARMAALSTGAEPEVFEDIRFTHAILPRIVMAILCGAALGVSGSLFQQVTQNRLASPLTLGAASGAWLAMVLATLLVPALAAAHGEWISLTGAALAFGLVVAIAGLRGLAGLNAILAGMAVNLLMGAIASAIVLLQSPYFGHLFVWGAGDLGQSGWERANWLLPRLLPALCVVLLLTRGLSLMRAGSAVAEARGLSLVPFFVAAVGLALYLTSLNIAAVGMIGFVGLIAPNIAHLAGARTPLAELCLSAALGALLLLGTDLIAVLASAWTRDIVPSGAAAALVGAPALIWLMRRRMGAADHSLYQLPPGPARLSWGRAAFLLAAVLGSVLAGLFIARVDAGWQVASPDALTLSLRWPRVLAAAGAGLGMALSGVILQRLIRNPLASPDILGMSSGAAFALIAVTLWSGGSIHQAGTGAAILGSLVVLALLLAIGRRHGHAPAMTALVGISLGALLDALIRFALASGSNDSFAIIGWLGGSTYRVAPPDAVALAAVACAALVVLLLLRQWLTLLSAGDNVALARGLSLRVARPASLTLAAALAAVVTAWLGPVTFVGLLAPHAAVMLGARRAGAQTVAAGGIGVALMVLSDWIGRTVLFPMQLPAGMVASLIGGAYFLFLLLRRKVL